MYNTIIKTNNVRLIKIYTFMLIWLNQRSSHFISMLEYTYRGPCFTYLTLFWRTVFLLYCTICPLFQILNKNNNKQTKISFLKNKIISRSTYQYANQLQNIQTNIFFVSSIWYYLSSKFAHRPPSWWWRGSWTFPDSSTGYVGPCGPSYGRWTWGRSPCGRVPQYVGVYRHHSEEVLGLMNRHLGEIV